MADIKINKLIIVFLVIVAAIGSLLYFRLDPSKHAFFPKCFFHQLTGLHCPGCGSQRAIHALLNGQFVQAAGYNILMIIFLPLVLFSALAFTWNAFSEKKIKQAIFYSPLFVKTLLVVVVLFWIVRNLPFASVSWMAP